MNIKSYAGKTPLSLAWSISHHQNNSRISNLITLLKEYGGKPDKPPYDTESDYSSDEEVKNSRKIYAFREFLNGKVHR